MLTTGDYLALDDYAFKSSPESCSGNSYSTEFTDFPSDVDFLQQLSSDLDIPLLLNPGEDEMSLLNSFFDKSPEEIMSEIALPAPKDRQFDDVVEQFSDMQHLELLQWGSEDFPNSLSEVKSEPSDSYSSSDSDPPNSPLQSQGDGTISFDIEDEIKSEPSTPSVQKSADKCIIVSPVSGSQIMFSPQRMMKLAKSTTKRVPIRPKTPYAVPQTKNKVVFTNSDCSVNYTMATTKNTNTKSALPKVVVLENISAIPITNVSSLPQIVQSTINNSIGTTCTVASMNIRRKNNLPVNIGNIDPRIIKRQQRKIKNRESACLSRKKKKDYLTSLENKVRDLTTENQHLKMQNLHLMQRLLRYEGSSKIHPVKNMKNSIILCMFLFTVGFNLDYIRSPFVTRGKTEVIYSTNLPKGLEHKSRNLLWAPEGPSGNTTNFSPLPMCPAAINQTESARLVLELERWIGKPKGPVVDDSNNRPKLNTPKAKSSPLKKRKQKKYVTRLVSPVYNLGKQLPRSHSNRELQVFTPSAEQLYNEFFEAINRQDDTFYVVSFSDHHMLLPALYHNKTRRPRMSLIMPSMLQNGNATQPTLVPLMQIDCEVLDTRLIQIQYGSIPQHLRAQGNTTSYQKTGTSGDLSESSTTRSNYTNKKAYKPYFMNNDDDHSDIYNMH